MPIGYHKVQRQIICKAIKYYLEMVSKNLNFWLGVYKIHNKQLVEIGDLLKFSIF
jgi:hypothetical protein